MSAIAREAAGIYTPGAGRTRGPRTTTHRSAPQLSRDQRQPPCKPRGPAPRVLRRERPPPPPPSLPARSPLHLHSAPRKGHASLYQRPASSAPAPPTPCLPCSRFRSHKGSASASGGFTSGSCVATQREAGEVAGELVRAVRVRARRAGLGFPPERCSPGAWGPGRPG